MALITKLGYSGSAPNITGFSGPSLATLVPGPEHQTIGTAGEAIAAGDVCYISDGSNSTTAGLIYRSNGTAAVLNGTNIAGRCAGIAAMKVGINEPVTLYHGVEFIYGSGLTPGRPVYVGATAGRLDDAPTTGGTLPIGEIQPDGARIFIRKGTY